jgi:hypothetical protein
MEFDEQPEPNWNAATREFIKDGEFLGPLIRGIATRLAPAFPSSKTVTAQAICSHEHSPG